MKKATHDKKSGLSCICSGFAFTRALFLIFLVPDIKLSGYTLCQAIGKMKLSVIVLVIFGLTYEVSSDEKITEKKGSEYIKVWIL